MHCLVGKQLSLFDDLNKGSVFRKIIIFITLDRKVAIPFDIVL